RLAQEVHDHVVERLVTLFLADLKHAGDLVRLAFADEVRDGHIDNQNFQSGGAPGPIDAFEKVLRDHALERLGQSGADLVLLVGWKDVDNSVNGLGGAGSMQRG